MLRRRSSDTRVRRSQKHVRPGDSDVSDLTSLSELEVGDGSSDESEPHSDSEPEVDSPVDADFRLATSGRKPRNPRRGKPQHAKKSKQIASRPPTGGRPRKQANTESDPEGEGLEVGLGAETGLKGEYDIAGDNDIFSARRSRIEYWKSLISLCLTADAIRSGSGALEAVVDDWTDTYGAGDSNGDGEEARGEAIALLVNAVLRARASS